MAGAQLLALLRLPQPLLLVPQPCSLLDVCRPELVSDVDDRQQAARLLITWALGDVLQSAAKGWVQVHGLGWRFRLQGFQIRACQAAAM